MRFIAKVATFCVALGFVCSLSHSPLMAQAQGEKIPVQGEKIDVQAKNPKNVKKVKPEKVTEAQQDKKVDKILKALTDKLTLTEQQQDTVRTLIEVREQTMLDARDKRTKRDEYREIKLAADTQFDAAVTAVLTEEQAATFAEMNKKGQGKNAGRGKDAKDQQKRSPRGSGK